LKRNSIVLGEKHIEGSYNRIMAAGELHIDNSDIRSLYIAGETHVNNSVIHKLRGAGEIIGESSTFDNVRMAGSMKLHGICRGDILAIEGELFAELLECRILRNGMPNDKKNLDKNNKIKVDINLSLNDNYSYKKKYLNDLNKIIHWKGTLKADTFESFYPIYLECEYEFRNIISFAYLTWSGEIVCDNFYSLDGGVCGEGINAENINIVLNDEITLQTIVGSNICICKSFQEDKLFKSIPKSANYKNSVLGNSMVSIPNIEGDRISIEYTKSDMISGVDVIIGDLCVIERVEYKNSIRISEKSVVNEVVKL